MRYKNYAVLMTNNEISEWCIFSGSFEECKKIFNDICLYNSTLQLIGTNEDIDTMLTYAILEDRKS